MTGMMSPVADTPPSPTTYPGIRCSNPDCDEKAGQDAVTSKNKAGCELAGKCVEACAAYGRVCPCVARAAGRAACEAITKLRENSRIFNSGEPSFAKLDPDDLIIGEKLGEGGFSVVNACTLKTDPEKKLAIKYLKRKIMVNQRQFEHGAADLAQEAHFLSELNHPHIIRLHGVTAGSVQTNVETGKECGFFITVDRLYDTLDKRLVRWREEQDKNNSGILSRISGEYKERKRQELRERVKIALLIVDAMCYLHDRDIIFRDLKPDNIGFDFDGVLKIFDLGLCKELKPGQANADGRYELTGNTGSRRYMAPEVAKELPYNKSVDSYSFGILLHEMLTAEKPFYGYSSGKHMSLVVIGGERPKMDSSRTAFWPLNLQWLMKRCWSPYSEKRPDFHAIKKTLQDVLQDKDDSIPENIISPRRDSQSIELKVEEKRAVETKRKNASATATLSSSIGALLRTKRPSKGKSNELNCDSVKGQRLAAKPWGWAFQK